MPCLIGYILSRIRAGVSQLMAFSTKNPRLNQLRTVEPTAQQMSKIQIRPGEIGSYLQDTQQVDAHCHPFRRSPHGLIKTAQKLLSLRPGGRAQPFCKARAWGFGQIALQDLSRQAHQYPERGSEM